ncbi:MAG TPA: hypothetical protein VML75_04170 [Kofleriaceae bacterium]|nr:hypothetical protein [Kofleriaceae bacterium]
MTDDEILDVLRARRSRCSAVELAEILRDGAKGRRGHTPWSNTANVKKLRAPVRQSTGATTHSVATPEGPVVCAFPSCVEIIAEDGAFYLLRNTVEGVCIADTWHLSEAEAKEQAAFEYGTTEEDWSEMDVQ